MVSAVSWLEDDVKALERLISSALPPQGLFRYKKNGRVTYRFGNASKPAFGATIQIGDEIHYQYGQWSNKVVKGRFLLQLARTGQSSSFIEVYWERP